MTTETSTRPRLQIGVIGLPSASEALHDADLDVITADTFTEAVAAVSRALDSAPRRFPVVIATCHTPGWRATVDRFAEQSRAVVAHLPGVHTEQPHATVAELNVPCTLAELLRACGAPARFITDAHETTPIEAPVSTPAAEEGFAEPAAAGVDDLDWDDLDDAFDDDQPPAIPHVPHRTPTPPRPAAPRTAASPTRPVSPATAPLPRVNGERSTPPPIPTRGTNPYSQIPGRAAMPPRLRPAEPAPVTPQPEQRPTQDPSQAATPASHQESYPPAAAPATPARPPAPTGPSPMPAQRDRRDEPPAPAVATPTGHNPPPRPTTHTPYPNPHRGEPDLEQLLHQGTARTRRAQILVVFGGKGGPGKSTLTHAVAATAADRGINTVLVDSNVGQADQRIIIGSGSHAAALPSIYDAAVTGDPMRAFIPPARLNESRPGRSPVNYVLVAGPPAELAAHEAITWDVYNRVIDAAAERAQLVVVDTQILEAKDDDGRKAEFIYPLLRSGAWGLGLSNTSNAALLHLNSLLKEMTSEGVPKDRLLSLVNQKPEYVELDEELLARTFGRYSTFLGTVDEDARIIAHQNSGEPLVDVPALANRVELVLERVCNLPVTTAPPGARHRGQADKPGLFGRLFGRRGVDAR